MDQNKAMDRFKKPIAVPQNPYEQQNVKHGLSKFPHLIIPAAFVWFFSLAGFFCTERIPISYFFCKRLTKYFFPIAELSISHIPVDAKSCLWDPPTRSRLRIPTRKSWPRRTAKTWPPKTTTRFTGRRKRLQRPKRVSRESRASRRRRRQRRRSSSRRTDESRRRRRWADPRVSRLTPPGGPGMRLWVTLTKLTAPPRPRQTPTCWSRATRSPRRSRSTAASLKGNTSSGQPVLHSLSQRNCRLREASLTVDQARNGQCKICCYNNFYFLFATTMGQSWCCL